MSARDRAGTVLFEVLVALTVLSLAGVALLSRTTSLLDAHERLMDRERQLLVASSVMAEVATLERADLVIRIGRREVSGFSVTVDRPRPELFRVGVAPADAPTAELLATALYRPAPERDR